MDDYRNQIFYNDVLEISVSTLRRWVQSGKLRILRERIESRNEINDHQDFLEPVELINNLDDPMNIIAQPIDMEEINELYHGSNVDTAETDSASNISNDSSDNFDFSMENDSENIEDFIMDNDDVDAMDKEVYSNSGFSVSECIAKLLSYFLRHSISKYALYDLFKIVHELLPKPNNVPKNKYFLFKFLHNLMPSCKIVKKHRMCENCCNYIGEYSNKTAFICSYCNSNKVNGIFAEYDLKSMLKDAFEIRNLSHFINLQENKNNIPNYISDVTSGSLYINLKKNVVPGNNDIVLLWNTDGLPVANNSNGQVWLVQAQILSVPPENRRNFQFVCGVYYSREKQPNMMSFLRPFINSLKDLYDNGFEWFDKTTSSFKHTKVIAPIATLDAPARAMVQNIMKFNGEFGCTFCEHPGESCKTGLGSTMVYPKIEPPPTLRTKERMTFQGTQAIEQDLKHVKGVKGLSITCLIPSFDVATSFVPDYMHSILLGTFRMLLTLWFDGKNKNYPFYVNKTHRNEIDDVLKQIFPPDYVTRTPRVIKYIHYWKASELRECLTHYFPVLLRNKLHKNYYNHFLLLVQATVILLKTQIHTQELNDAESLLNKFTDNIEPLYDRKKCSFNVHQITHIVENVRRWGPIWAWSAFPFEDGNGQVKKRIHGPNKIEMEIVNTMYILNAQLVLEHKLLLRNNTHFMDENFKIKCLGRPRKPIYTDNELEAISQFCQSNGISINNISVYNKIKLGKDVYTSIMYKRQKKRNNYFIYWNNTLFGTVLYYFSVQGLIYAVVRQFVKCYDAVNNIVNRDLNIDLSSYIIPVRDTYCIRILPANVIQGKVIRIQNYVCFSTNTYEKK